MTALSSDANVCSLSLYCVIALTFGFEIGELVSRILVPKCNIGAFLALAEITTALLFISLFHLLSVWNSGRPKFPIVCLLFDLAAIITLWLDKVSIKRSGISITY